MKQFINYGFVSKILFWIYSWGDTITWMIKIRLLAVGATLYFLAPKEVVEKKIEAVKTEE